jgi:pimeloyl-ACP methyl ester carboxylesterase
MNAAPRALSGKRNAALMFVTLGILVPMLTGCTAYVQRRAAISGGRKVEYSKNGSGRPVIVFMSGLGNTMDTWRDVYWSARGVSTAVIYNRMGYGRSSKTREPRTGEIIVSELREFLTAAGYRPPYVLVAHSASGLYAVYYAKKYPGEICGMVLVDASHWDQVEYLKNQKQTFLTSVISVIGAIASLFVDSGMAKEEFADLGESSRQVVQAGQFPGIPLAVLYGIHHGPAGPITEGKWLEWQQDLARLSPRGRLIAAKRSGHFIQKTQPALISDAIKDVLADADTLHPDSCR